jgi:hypothetical protein
MTEVVLDASVVMKWFLADGERNPNLRDRSVLLSRRASWSSSRRRCSISRSSTSRVAAGDNAKGNRTKWTAPLSQSKTQ